MATVNMAYIMFDNTIKQVINHWGMDGEITKHDDFRNYLIHILFTFRHRYLSVNDTIAFAPNQDRKNILDDVVGHIKEIKNQFYYYFNDLWC